MSEAENRREARMLDAAWAEIQPAVARRLMIGAVQAFAARGYHATTTRDIARRAGLSPAGVYVHFASKEDLLFQIILVGHQQSLQVVQQAAARCTGADPETRVRTVVGDFATWHARHHTTGRVIQYELAALSGERHAQIAGLRREMSALVREILESGVRSGTFQVNDLNGATLALLSLTIDVARWYRDSGRRRPEDIGNLYADLAIRMLRTGPLR